MIRYQCKICSIKYTYEWNVPDYLWRVVTGRSDSNHDMCIDCFDILAEEMDVTIYWHGDIKKRGLYD